jgi:hypothetical protein
MDAHASPNAGGHSVRTPYEAPQLRLLGTVGELTEACFLGKSWGNPDYTFHIPVPITRCSA